MVFRSGVFRPSQFLRARFVPPWVQDGQTMESFFDGILKSRNPYERLKRDTQRYTESAERVEAIEALKEAEDSADRKREAETTEAILEENRRFLPYGSEPMRYFDRSNVAAWGKYVAGVSQSSSSSSLVGKSPTSHDGYDASDTKRLLLSDMDAPLAYAIELLPPPGPDPQRPYKWPLGGTFGVVLDIDGVIYRSGEVLEGSDTAVRMLQKLKIPFVFMTNGGSGTEASKAEQLTRLLRLDAPIVPDQVIMAYSPMRLLVDRHGHENVLVAGDGDCAGIAKSFGFDHAVGMLEYQALHPELVPLKRDWRGMACSKPNSVPHIPFGAILVMNDLADALNDIQVMLDVAISPLGEIGEHVSGLQTVPIYWQADDLFWAAGARLPRLGGGAFREMFSSIFMSVTGRELEVTCYGKPRAIAYAYAEERLEAQCRRLGWSPQALRTIAMVGDNLETDIIGANARGKRWLSVHVMTGIGAAPAAARTISQSDLELQWLTEFPQRSPHYIAPSLDHFLREAIGFGEDMVTMNKTRFYGKPSPVDLADQYNFIK